MGKDGVAEQTDILNSNIRHISIFSYTGVAITHDNDLYYLDGRKPPFWKEKAKHAIARGEFTVVQDMKGQWHVFAHGKTPRGKELETLNRVLNQPSTIDVECSLYFSERNSTNTASYAVWIEEPGTPPVDVTQGNATPIDQPPVVRGGGSGKRNFFGVEIE